MVGARRFTLADRNPVDLPLARCRMEESFTLLYQKSMVDKTILRRGA